MSVIIPVTAGTAMIAGMFAYMTWYSVTHEHSGVTAVESWLVARFKRRELDRELVKMIGHAEVTEEA